MLEGRNFVENHCKSRSGGRVGWFMNESILFPKRDDPSFFDEYIECVLVDVANHVLNTSRNIVISVIYLPPNTDIGIFIDDINIFLNTKTEEYKLCYLSWYYKLNVLKYIHCTTADFIDAVYSHVVLLLVQEPKWGPGENWAYKVLWLIQIL